ncbi:hypothetical protein ACFX2I_017129 [Malus domestica]|uniref:uncharacterized protein n=1 Tax=Malus domestica TaxID=3750 RepID=UPI0010A9B88C|nr:uncharacterized protein LOC103456231 [Malus domestica]XP_050129186.1 uncharacterized protein LOC126605794 [Malus sylvestris]
MVVQDDWTRAAMTDDVLVVELLLRLKQAQAAGPSSSLRSSSPMSQSLLTLRWGVRMPRSKAASSGSRFDGGVLHQRNSGKNGADSTTRCSPTTPLSWSGGTGSPSATADGFEESSCPRSKGNGTYESTSTTNAAKRARRKKTYAELKEQESSLLKERTHLEKEIATLQATFKEQRAKNVNFKRIKIDLDLHSARNLSANFDGAGKAISSQPHERIASSSTTAYYIPSDLPPSPHPRLDSCVESNDVPARDNSFLLPDLNMVPAVEESGSEMLYGMS